ncbi:60S ribosomal protein L28 [Pseudozyma hubeiensis SY62]|uniref:60S ribosomal protein L28 n=1 Tax=Pseudozyma hubeiensis (strain SY62) TaxID=1305764 RepID=R9P3R1_PSEHS|nr:60S ribosomal protein L28 [Pseudozyma hubeiensis SY62]GAC95867.1 60S ribosomal protein L28 [Pseudozyma hubeiensis SY62]
MPADATGQSAEVSAHFGSDLCSGPLFRQISRKTESGAGYNRRLGVLDRVKEICKSQEESKDDRRRQRRAHARTFGRHHPPTTCSQTPSSSIIKRQIHSSKMASQDLQWLLVRNNSSFLVKQKGLGRIFSREPRNLVQLHSYKYSGVVNAKAVGLEAPKSGKGVVLTTKNGKQTSSAIKKTLNTTTLKKGGGRRTAGAVSNVVAKKGYRADLTRAACGYTVFALNPSHYLQRSRLNLTYRGLCRDSALIAYRRMRPRCRSRCSFGSETHACQRLDDDNECQRNSTCLPNRLIVRRSTARAGGFACRIPRYQSEGSTNVRALPDLVGSPLDGIDCTRCYTMHPAETVRAVLLRSEDRVEPSVCGTAFEFFDESNRSTVHSQLIRRMRRQR